MFAQIDFCRDWPALLITGDPIVMPHNVKDWGQFAAEALAEHNLKTVGDWRRVDANANIFEVDVEFIDH